MAFVHSFLQGSQGMHAFFREAAGGSDAKQRESWGVVLFRSWRRRVALPEWLWWLSECSIATSRTHTPFPPAHAG